MRYLHVSCGGRGSCRAAVILHGANSYLCTANGLNRQSFSGDTMVNRGEPEVDLPKRTFPDFALCSSLAARDLLGPCAGFWEDCC